MKLLLILVLVAGALAKKRYDGYQVFRTVPATDDQIQMIRTMHEHVELDFWTDTDVMVPPTLLDFVRQEFDSVDMYYEIAHENVQEELDAEELQLSTRTSKAFDLNDWNTYEQIIEALDFFVANCPAGVSCSKVSMGSSYNGRDVPALTIRSGNKPLVYLDSLIHCREWLAGATTLSIANRLITGTDAEAARLRDNYNWYIAPVINPDGYVYTWNNERLWRKNREPNQGSSCVGTDLNRNFDASWRFSGTSTLPCSDTYGGPSAGSAIETQNVQNKLNELAASDNLYGVVSYHAYANMWLHAYGYTTIAGGSTCARSAYHNQINAVALAARNAIQSTGGQSWQYGPVCSVIYPASGSTVDYCHDKSGMVYAFTPEVRGNSFAPSASLIEPNYREQWAGLVAMVDAIAQQ